MDFQSIVVEFEKREFFDAVEDYTTAIELDSKADQAYFGRGMALARQGMIGEGIADLSVFIKRNPKSSLAYTKRGVRYVWLQDFNNAEKDLTKALVLDPENAEAHDDLSVIYASIIQFTIKPTLGGIVLTEHFRPKADGKISFY